MKKIVYLFLVFFVLNLSSCISNDAYEITSDNVYYSFKDSTNTQVILSKHPERVAVLFSSYADIWALSGGRIDITVGETLDRGFCENDVLLVDDGTGHNAINLELLTDAKPDFVIGTADYNGQTEACEFMRNHGVPSALFTVEDFEDYLEVLRIFCDINGNSEAYTKYGENVNNEIDGILETVNSLDATPRKVLFMRAGSSAKSTKAKNSRDNFVCRILCELGAVNIADSIPFLLDGLSMETIIKENPEYIFISPMGDPKASENYVLSLFNTDVWQSLDCIKNKNYTFLPKELFHFKPNSRWADAYRYLAKILYPESEIE